MHETPSSSPQIISHVASIDLEGPIALTTGTTEVFSSKYEAVNFKMQQLHRAIDMAMLGRIGVFATSIGFVANAADALRDHNIDSLEGMKAIGLVGLAVISQGLYKHSLDSKNLINRQIRALNAHQDSH